MIQHTPETNATLSFEHSQSARILDRVIAHIHPSRYPIYFRYRDLMRKTDNLVDEGTSYTEAKLGIVDQINVIQNTLRNRTVQSHTPYGSQLSDLINSIPSHLQTAFCSRYRGLLDYFEVDLEQRSNLRPYSLQTLSTHIEGGFPEFFGGLKIILNDQDLSGNRGYRVLARTHGDAEPLVDIQEDLERGIILHARENGATWIDKLQIGKEIPYQEIDQYVIKRRGPISRRMFKLAKYAHQEFGGIVGALMTLDYYKRALQHSNRRFLPNEPIIFAKNRMEA